MKKIVMIMVVVFGVQLMAQGQPFEKGDKTINLGIGIGSALYSGKLYKMRIPPISLSYEQGITNKLGIGYIGVGGYFGISGSKWETEYLTYEYGWKYTYIVLGARGAYHFDLVDNLDLYAGLILGVNIVSSKEIGDWPAGVAVSEQSTGVAHSEFAGIRWFFKPNFALMAELGYGISYLTVGASYKF